MFALILSVGIFIGTLIGVGRLLRRCSPKVRRAILIMIPITLFIAVILFSSYLSVGVYGFYTIYPSTCTVACDTPREDYEAHRLQYIFWMSLPPAARPACDSLPDLCALERSYEMWTVSAWVGAIVAIFGFSLVFLASRNPKPLKV